MCRRFHNEQLHSLYRSPNIVRVIKSRRLRWVGHVARMEICKSALIGGTPTEKRPLGRPVIKSRRLRWVGYVARMEEGRSAFKI